MKVSCSPEQPASTDVRAPVDARRPRTIQGYGQVAASVKEHRASDNRARHGGRHRGLPRRKLIGLVIDTQNLLSSALHLGFGRIDYARIIADIVAGSPWLGIACVALPTSGKSVIGFQRYLERLHLQVAIWNSPTVGGRVKCDLDPLVVCKGTTMLHSSPLWGLCVVGGDIDYKVLADACHLRRIRFGLVGFCGSVSTKLAGDSDWVLELDRRHAAD